MMCACVLCVGMGVGVCVGAVFCHHPDPLPHHPLTHPHTHTLNLPPMHLPIYPLPSPHCRYVMDRWGFPTTWAATVGLGVLWSLLLLYDAEGTLLPSFVCYALFRTFLFTFLFAYIADTLGFRCAPLPSLHPLSLPSLFDNLPNIGAYFCLR